MYIKEGGLYVLDYNPILETLNPAPWLKIGGMDPESPYFDYEYPSDEHRSMKLETVVSIHMPIRPIFTRVRFHRLNANLFGREISVYQARKY